MAISFLWNLVKQEKNFKYYALLSIIVAILSIIGPLLLGKIVEVATSQNPVKQEFVIAGVFFASVSLIKHMFNFVSIR
ncbi:MAG TPA: hypothetical protein DCL21_02510, partial [Alphaproteobacteria bacterium]|nr:hypothetical protein [Alphaproteobacteria bacterium]